MRSGRQTWEREYISTTAASIAALEVLNVQSLGLKEVKAFGRSTDLTVLRRLSIHYPLTAESLHWLRRRCEWRSLEDLEISIGTLVDHHNGFTKKLAGAAEEFLTSLPKLRSVKLMGAYTQWTVDCLIQHSGPRLRRLSLALDNDRPS